MATSGTSEMTHGKARDLVRRAITHADRGQWSCIGMRGRSYGESGEMYSITARAESTFNDPDTQTIEIEYDFQLTADGLDYSKILSDMIWEFDQIAKEYI